MDGIKGRISEFFETNGQRNWTSTKEKKNVTNRFFYALEILLENLPEDTFYYLRLFPFSLSNLIILLFKYLYSRVEIFSVSYAKHNGLG